MIIKDALNQLNFASQCRKYNLSLWQCPSFLFLIMGVIIIVSMLGTYFIGVRYYEDPEIVALITIIISLLLLVVSFAINQGFERLAEASRMKSEFVSIVSHQLRTPLSAMNWALELFLTDKIGQFNSKQLEYLATLKSNNEQMINLVNDLLDVSKIDQEKFPLSPQKFSLTRMINDIIPQFGSFAAANNVILESEFSDEIFVFADPLKIKQVLWNILDNAIRYIQEKGKVSINISQTRDQAKVEISDNGVGIPIMDQAHIFQKFFRSKNVMRNQTNGSGLGLFIAKAVIEKSEGQIGFRSKEGDGSVFWFTLPKAK